MCLLLTGEFGPGIMGFGKCSWCHNPVVCFVIWTGGIAGSIKGKRGERLKIGDFL